MAENARYEDAAAGWAVYRRTQGNVNRPDLNLALVNEGYREISPRTFTHYRKLLRLGYTEYVSINRLDLRHANSSVFNVSDRSRYQDHPFQSAGLLLIPKGSTHDRFYGRISRVSEGFASLLTPTSDKALKVANATKYKRGVLVFESVAVERAVEVVEAREIDGLVEIMVSFRSLLETDLLFPATNLELTTSRLHINLGPRPPLSKVLEVVRRSFDLFESSRSIIEVAGSDGLDALRPITATPRVRRLNVENPVDIDIFVDPNLLAVITAIVGVGVARFDKLASGAKTVQEMFIAHKQGKHDEAQRPLELRSRQLETWKTETEIIKTLAESRQTVLDNLGIDLAAIPPERLPKLELLKDQALEATIDLQASSSQPIEISEIEPEDEDDEFEYYSYEDQESE